MGRGNWDLNFFLSITRGLTTGTTSGKANFSKIIFIKMILLKLTKRPPGSSPPPRGGVFLLILALEISRGSLKL